MRAEAVERILINEGISKNQISLFGKGENELSIITPDEVKHPANRRAELKIVN
jgi:Outer membrane protein and related peptidoglycan-associated (lipo)proteins